MEDLRQPREGDVHQVYKIAGRRVKVIYGYYTRTDREQGALCPIYPDFQKHPIYDAYGKPLTAALGDACLHNVPKTGVRGDGWCADCVYYPDEREDIALCECAMRRRPQDQHQREEIK